MSSVPWLCWTIPFVGFVITVTIGRKLGRIRDYIEPLFTLVSAICASLIAYRVLREGEVIHESVPWIEELGIGIGVFIDPLSAIMTCIVTWIGFLILVYSVKYMEDDPSVVRFWAMMNLFVGGMLLLVLADNMIQMFIGWELVGVASFSLIGYYYRDEHEYWVGNYPPSHCSMKAFVVTKIGDLLMLIGILLIYVHAGTLNFVELASELKWVESLAKSGLLLPTLLFLLGGPLGKSAQFPLHEWLPEAMAGPTPVSALIHAATMVKAGIYFMARILPILHYAAWVMGYQEVIVFFYVVAMIGAFTTFLAGSQAMVARELKKILAYSTISQLGYMMLGIGVAGLLKDYVLGLSASIFHLLSHAVFKALLFLSAGAVIHVAETKDVYEMGGLRKYMKITFFCMLIGALALAGVPPLSGFWSKDAILLSSALSGRMLPLILGIITAGVTMFYSLRMIGLVFFGEKSTHLKRLEEEGHHLHEVHPLMWVPYGIMAILTIIIGAIGPLIEGELHHLLAINLINLRPAEAHSIGYVIVTPRVEEVQESLWHLLVPGVSIIALAIGGVPSYLAYISRSLKPEDIMARSSLLRALYKFLVMRWYINPVYYAVFVNGLLSISKRAYFYLESLILNGFNNAFATFMSGLAKLMFDAIEISVLERFNVGFVSFFKSLSDTLLKYMEYTTFEGFNFSIAKFFSNAFKLFRKVQTGILAYNVTEMIIGLLILILLLASMLIGGV